MKTVLELEVEKPGKVRKAIQKSLETDERVRYKVDGKEQLEISIETDTLGALRGSTDTAFRLTMLADKIC